MALYFVIAFVGRSGSSYLEGLLNSHPDAQCLGEILWPGADPRNVGRSTSEFLDIAVHSAKEPVSGFKFGHLHIRGHPEVRAILRDKQYRVIHLTRQNRVDQYISMKLAMINNAWRSDYGSWTQCSFRADPADMQEKFKIMEDDDAFIAEFTEGLPTIKLTYEELIKPLGYYPVLDFLGLSRRELHSPFERQRTGTQRDAMENYDDIAAHFAGTPMGRHFTE
jgi:hypothetical protein